MCVRRHHCRFCKRLLCHNCSSVQLDKKYYPQDFQECVPPPSFDNTLECFFLYYPNR